MEQASVQSAISSDVFVRSAYLHKAEGVALLHEAFDAAAHLVEAHLVLTDPGDVLLNGRAVDLALGASEFSQCDDEALHSGLHLVLQERQALLCFLPKLLDETPDGKDRGTNSVSEEKCTKYCQ